MRKRIVGALAALFVAVLFVAPATALAAWPTTGTLWVDGQDLMADDDHTITCSDGGTARYDPDTLTLTLTNAQITQLDDQGKGIDAPYANTGLTIVLEGESKTGPIQARSLTFEGDGSLDVSGTSSPVCWTPKDLAVNGGTVTVTGNVQVQGNLTVSAGTLDVAVANNHAVVCSGPVTVKDATFLASSENYMGVYVTAGDFTATNSTVDLSGSSYALYTAGNTSFTGGSTTLTVSDDEYFSLYAEKGIAFDGGDAGAMVTIKAPGTYGSYTGGMLVSKGDVTFGVTALHGLTAVGNVELTGAKGTITAENAAIFSDTEDVVLSACDLGLSGEMTLNSPEGDITIEGSDLTVSGTDAVHAKGDLLIDRSQLDVTATLRPISTGSGNLTIQGDETHIDATGTRFLGTGGLFTMTGGTLDVDIALAEGEDLAAGIYGNDGISISGGTVNAKATGAEGASAYGAISNGEISVTGGIVTVEGSTGALYASKDGGSVSTGDDAWYQWATAPVDASTPASETAYAYGTGSETYLRFEPVGTEYGLTVKDGTGSASYAAGSVVNISANAPAAGQHFAGWTVEPNGAGVLKDADASSTTFTMPACDVTLTATYGEHEYQNGVCTVCGARQPGQVTPPSNPTYPPEVEEGEGGAVEVTPGRPHEGDEVTVAPDPDEGQVVDEVTVVGDDGEPVDVVDNGDGTWSFEQPRGAVTITVTFRCDGGELCPTRVYGDVPVDAWYHGAVDWVVERGLLSGFADGTMGPGGVLSRAQLVTVLYRRAGSPETGAELAFADCDPGAFYADAVAWAASEGVVFGYADGTYFGPADPVTREQFATILWRQAGEPEGSGDLSAFPDADTASAYAVSALEWAVGAGVLSGHGSGELGPTGVLSRGMLAAVLQRIDG